MLHSGTNDDEITSRGLVLVLVMVVVVVVVVVVLP